MTEIYQYAAGMFDSDGCIKIAKEGNVDIRVGQAEKGKNVLEFLQKNFKGVIQNGRKATKRHQAEFQWCIYGDQAREFCAKILPYLLVKTQQVELGLQVPTINTQKNPVNMYNTITKETSTYCSFRDCCIKNNLSYHKYVGKLAKNAKITVDNYEITKIQIDKNAIKILKKTLTKKITDLKYVCPIIPNNVDMSIPYAAGFFDGDGCVEVEHNSAHHHTIGQKYRPILDIFQEKYGGTICYKPSSKNFQWCICADGKEFLQEIYPYLILKKQQAELVINMKKNEAPEIKKKIRLLKGNYTQHIEQPIKQPIKPIQITQIPQPLTKKKIIIKYK